jgi:arylsulfatase A-like enzyme
MTGTAETHSADFIVVDALRADHLGIYGYDRPTSPNLDRFSAEGAVFERAYSQASWTIPSMASYMTSLYQGVHGVSTTPKRENFRVLGPEFTTLAESFRDQGLKTAAVTNHAWFRRKMGITAGFEEIISRKDLSDHPREAEFLTDAAIGWLKEKRDGDFLLYVHYMGTHHPYNAPPPYRGLFSGGSDGAAGTIKRARALKKRAEREGLAGEDIDQLLSGYDEKAAYTDEHLGRLLDFLEEEDFLKSTAVVVTADHGEAFGEHGSIYHGGRPYNEVLHVPLIIRAPGASAGRRVEEPVGLIDIFPTLHELLGLEVRYPIQGRSLIPSMEGGRRDGFTAAQGKETKVITSRWSAFAENGGGEVLELYDLTTDPLEQNDLAGREPGTAREMSALAASLWEEIEELKKVYHPVATETDLDPETVEKLKSLGYLQ